MSGTARRAIRAGAVALALITGVALVSALVDSLVPGRHGPTSSSYATTPGGLAAYAELLARAGHPVAQLRRPPAAGLLRSTDTVVLLDPDAVLPSEGRALAGFVAAGGDLLTGGSSGDAFLSTILPRAPRLGTDAPTGAQPLGAAAETAGVRRVVALGQAGWIAASAPAGFSAALGVRGRAPLLLVGRMGRGRVALLADASPLQNRLLARADNARLGVDLAGPGRRPVVFVESAHGYGIARGLGALPARWWSMFAGLTLAGIAWIAARWPRLGPPSTEGRVLPPARGEYLQAMTAILRRADAPAEVAELARGIGRRLLSARAGPRGAADAASRRDALGRVGVSEEHAVLLLDDAPLRAEDLVGIGTVLARLQAGPDRAGTRPQP